MTELSRQDQFDALVAKSPILLNRLGKHHLSKLTPETVEKFFTEFARSGAIGKSADAAGITPTTVERWRKQYPEFNSLCQEAYALFKSNLEAEIHRRAVEGVEKTIYDRNGEAVGTETKYSDTLLIFLAKRHMPEFRTEQTVNVNTNSGLSDQAKVDLKRLSRQERDQLEKLISKAAGREMDVQDIEDAQVVEEPQVLQHPPHPESTTLIPVSLDNDTGPSDESQDPS